MRTNLDTDPKVVEMATLLNVDEFQVIGMLWRVWCWADQHSLDGNAIRVTCVTLDRFTRCKGFSDALRKVGWLDGRDNAITFPRFAEHNGQTAKKRAETNKRVSKHRNAIGVTKALPEKRREEKSKDIERNREKLISVIPDRWRTNRIEEAVMVWESKRSDVDGTLIGLDEIELKLQIGKFAKLDEESLYPIIADAASSGWKTLQSSDRKKRFGDSEKQAVSVGQKAMRQRL